MRQGFFTFGAGLDSSTAKKMKNPQSKPYTGPKTFKKLIKSVPNLYGVSCAPTSNPLYLKETSSSLLRRRSHENSKGIDLTLVPEAPTTKKKTLRLLKSKQELLRRSGNIWANKKERLSLLTRTKEATGLSSWREGFLPIKTDFWDLKKTSKSCLLSSQTRLTSNVNGLMASSILGSSHPNEGANDVSKAGETRRGRQLIPSREGKTIVILKNYAALATKN